MTIPDDRRPAVSRSRHLVWTLTFPPRAAQAERAEAAGEQYSALPEDCGTIIETGTDSYRLGHTWQEVADQNKPRCARSYTAAP